MTNPYIKLAVDPAVTNQLRLNRALADVCGGLPEEITALGLENVKRNIRKENKSKLRKYLGENRL